VYDISQAGLLPPLGKKAAGIITDSEAIFKGLLPSTLLPQVQSTLYQRRTEKSSFTADEVDTDMLQQLQASIDSGDVQIINMHAKGDGEQVLARFRRPVEKVLHELMADMRLAGCQHFGFQEYKDPRGNCLFAGHSNGSVSFQLAQLKVGEGKVPVSIVLYIDRTHFKKGIPIRPVYRKCIYISSPILCVMLYPISYPI
jgi:hypothetical protein